jgi:uncharacterized repeat protein (TIGR01451 family)
VLTYSITATNSGTADGTADISDNVTAIQAHATISNISDGGILANGTITWPQFTLTADGGSKTVTFTATLNASFPAGTTTLPNAVVVVGTGSNCTPQDNEDADCNTTTTVQAAPHLTAFKVVQDGNGPFVHTNTAQPGDVLTWKITITNDGNAPVTPVLHAEDIKAILLHAKYDNDCSGACQFGNGILNWTISSLAANGGSVTLTFSVTLDAVFPQGTTVLPNAVVVEDSNCVPTNNQDADCTTHTTVSAFELTITKSNNAPLESLDLPDGTTASLPTAKEGSTVTYTLGYHVGDLDVNHGVIHDVLPVGVTYVTGSATNNAEFTFAGYDAGTRTLSWTAVKVTTDGTLSYMATVDVGASLKSQPLTNTATIHSDETGPDSASSDIFVPAPPLPQTHKPTPPPTDTLAPTTGPSNPGSSLALIMAALATLILGLSFVTPVPAAVRRRNRR